MSNRSLEPSELTGPLLRAARALAQITIADLAEAAELGVSTLKRAEASKAAVDLTASNARRVVEAYALLGIVFIAEREATGVLARPSRA